MALSDEHQIMHDLIRTAEDIGKPPKIRIKAAKKRLKDSLDKSGKFSGDAVRLGRRIAKLFMADEAVSAEVRQKATKLYQYIIDQRETDEDDDTEPDESSIAEKIKLSTTGNPQTLEERNAGWDSEPIPKKWLEYRDPADLIPYGIPAEPDFQLKDECR